MASWSFEPSVVLGMGLWLADYLLIIGPVRARRQWGPRVPGRQVAAFCLGTLVALAALVSPLDALADQTLFSAHMVQHMLLTFVAPPLWLLGTPGWLVARLIPRRWLEAATQPLVAFAVFNGVMWIWHVPAAYDAALRSEPLHIFEHLCFMAAAVIGWWPVLAPTPGGRLAPPLRLAYLVPSLFSCTALAALITLSSAQLYGFYGHAAAIWGLTPLADQQLGGLAMWLPGDMLYLALIVWTVSAFFDGAGPELQSVRA